MLMQILGRFSVEFTIILVVIIVNLIPFIFRYRYKMALKSIEFKIVWDADWMVNFPGRYKNKSNDEISKKIKEIFKTPTGRQIAEELFVNQRG